MWYSVVHCYGRENHSGRLLFAHPCRPRQGWFCRLWTWQILMWCLFFCIWKLCERQIWGGKENIFERNSEQPKVHKASAEELIPTWWLIFLTTIFFFIIFSLFAEQLRRLGPQTELAIEICFLFLGYWPLKLYFHWLGAVLPWNRKQ